MRKQIKNERELLMWMSTLARKELYIVRLSLNDKASMKMLKK